MICPMAKQYEVLAPSVWYHGVVSSAIFGVSR
eukprot:CAMPEP_0174384618 /NCGR_PEP_ID=MMETSP0811_2-20130205/126039_1 /TAXON_ID=73025 ORGANISM="Eutreptiella gymnastica-like, Strain CCMP1594" /NCGR_SAMPLE_ID=MMETSP0811_2 /ASSEMBLY_ACC=CAM_ASM_000667 /LENGTH=31 /DNA_ID= /DNA_START= /DNA_END= /DNA_ORIENTATION=